MISMIARKTTPDNAASRVKADALRSSMKMYITRKALVAAMARAIGVLRRPRSNFAAPTVTSVSTISAMKTPT